MRSVSNHARLHDAEWDLHPSEITGVGSRRAREIGGCDDSPMSWISWTTPWPSPISASWVLETELLFGRPGGQGRGRDLRCTCAIASLPPELVEAWGLS